MKRAGIDDENLLVFVYEAKGSNSSPKNSKGSGLKNSKGKKKGFVRA